MNWCALYGMAAQALKLPLFIVQITEDFVKLIGNKSESGALSDNERSTRENLENRNELNEDVFNPSAEQLVEC